MAAKNTLHLTMSDTAAYDDDGRPRRTGTVWTGVAHIITAVIGSGVLSLAWSTAQLGWIGGPIALLSFAVGIYVSSCLLADCYRSPVTGKRNYSYIDAVKANLGTKRTWVAAFLQFLALYGTGIAYTITTATSISAILKSNCYHKKGHEAPCKYGVSSCMIIYGVLEIVMSFIPDLHNMAWVSVVAAIMSFSYSFIGLGLGIATVIRTLWSAVAHIIAGVIGSGVLSLAWSTSQLGWIGGPLALLCFAIISYISSCILADCYRSPDSVTGKRNHSYMDAVKANLGTNRTRIAGFLQFLALYGTCIAYVITTATSLSAIMKSNCYHKRGHKAPCSYGGSMYMVMFGAVQIVMSFIPDLHNMAWVSVVAAIMSFSYSFIGLGLGIATVIKNGRIMGSLRGIPTEKTVDKMWLIFQGIADISFSYPYPMIFLEIQDTLGSPPPENQTMKKATMVGILITTFFYLCCGCSGYAAFGNNTPGNLLTGFGFYEPYWLVDFANACIILHLVGGYQIYSQPIYGTAEKCFSRRFSNSGFVNDFHKLKLPLLPCLQINLFRICFRTVFVISTTAIAILFPYFNQVLGVLGAINFWPLAIFFPIEMYIVQKNIAAWSSKWIVLRTFSVACFLVNVIGLVGSLEGIIRAKLSHLNY
ncbi:hypothetical protein RJT34_12728 [Clitoria ternatea]|uniref:Amino acid transporter transmembrane domain-containing protein n=1 Tax=Clitoria ternatea TaxID=43366 RepID=A0AAN9JQD2_CLITE